MKICEFCLKPKNAKGNTVRTKNHEDKTKRFMKSDFCYTLKNDYSENISGIVNVRLYIETQEQYLWLHSITGKTGYTGFLLLQGVLKLHTKINWVCTK